MTQQPTHKQIAWRVAQELPRGAHVRLGAGMPLLVPGYVATESGIVFESGHVDTAQRVDHCIVGAREVTQNGDFVAFEETQCDVAGVRHVFVIADYFARDGRPTLVPQCTSTPTATQCVTRLFTDLAVIDLHDGKAWLREIVEGITLHVLQAETDVELHVAPGLRLLHAPKLA